MGFFHINFIFLQGHGGDYKKDPCLLIPDKTGKIRILNVGNLAKNYARYDKTITIIFFDACREDLEKHEYKSLFDSAIQDDEIYKFEPLKFAHALPGYSVIFFSCK